MLNSQRLAAKQPMINPDLAEKLSRFQAILHARLQALSAFDRLMMVLGVGLASCMELGTTTAVNVILPDNSRRNQRLFSIA